jgi:hypothetical protein
MGNQLLIGLATGTMLLTSTVLKAEITINDIDKLVNDIKQERSGLTNEEIKTAVDPFVYYKNGEKPILKTSNVSSVQKKKLRFILTAIVDKRVKINNKWYSLHDTVNGYKINNIGDDYVLLSRNATKVRVFIKRPHSKKINFIVK